MSAVEKDAVSGTLMEKHSEETLRLDLSSSASSRLPSELDTASERLNTASQSINTPSEKAESKISHSSPLSNLLIIHSKPTGPCPPRSSPRPSGVLRHERVPISSASGKLEVTRQDLFNGIPLAAIMLLDLANSGDFPANVFNDRPVEVFAMALMAVGATFALVMSVMAFLDARRSWATIGKLRKEQLELHSKSMSTTGSEKAQAEENPMLQTFIHLNRRDLGTEFFERFGMEVFMGVAAFLVAVGTYMAIGGDNDDVFLTSNLLSGYIGNAPAVIYGIINSVWSVLIYLRARRQRKAANVIAGGVHARAALYKRAKFIQVHAAFSGFSCLVSGALGMVTPTQWQPYPVLAVLGLMFAYTMWLFRRRVGYVRASLAGYKADLTTADLVHEIDQLLDLREKTLAATQEPASKQQERIYDRAALAELLHQLTLCGAFEKFCIGLTNSNSDLSSKTSEGQVAHLIMQRQIHELTPEVTLSLADEVDTTADPGSCAGKDGAVYQALGESCARLLRKKAILRRISMRSRFLVEMLGSHMISFPDDRATFDKQSA